MSPAASEQGVVECQQQQKQSAHTGKAERHKHTPEPDDIVSREETKCRKESAPALTLERYTALDHVIQGDAGGPDIHLRRRKRAHALWATMHQKGQPLATNANEEKSLGSTAESWAKLWTPPGGQGLKALRRLDPGAL